MIIFNSNLSSPHCSALLAVVLWLSGMLSSTAQAQVVPLPGALPPAIGFSGPSSNQLVGPPLPSRFNNPQPQSQIQQQALQRARIRIKDITVIEGHRSNTLTGIGLVTGLKGTGGQSQLTQDSVANFLRRYDVLAGEIPTGSAAVVVVNAEIPPFFRPGEKIKATVSVFDDASGLFGGILQLTELIAIDGQAYATANGAVILSGFSAGGAAGGISKNHDTSGKVQATLEVDMQTGPAFPGKGYRLLLTNKDYATANRIAAQINTIFPGHARARDQGTVEVAFPPPHTFSKMGFVERVNELTVVPDIPARVVINQKTGTIVVGQNVKLSKVLFANENLVITTNETPIVSQPAPFSQGQTTVLPRTQVTATETGGTYNLLSQQTTVGDLAAMLNTLGVQPRDLIGIFQDIQATGALQAQLIIE